VILVDTGPLVAIVDASDAQHTRAVDDLDRFVPMGLTICEAVLVEATFLLRTTGQRDRLKRLLAYTKASPIRADEDLWDDVFAWLLKYAEHEPDWADACLAVLAGRDRQYRVWTFDDEFRSIWRRPDGSAIPLARRK
jgi:predicted nucleic acid-binding protein